MKWFFLLVCLGCAMANDHDKLLDELEEMLASKKDATDESHAANIDENASQMFNQILHSLEQQDEEDSRSKAETDDVSSLYDGLFQDDDQIDKRVSQRKKTDERCMDGISIPYGPGQQGCPRILCYDKQVGTCNTDFRSILRMAPGVGQEKARKMKCLKRYFYYRELCPHTCRNCKPASPQKTCRKQWGSAAIHGCCIMNGVPALRPDRKDCMPCRDSYPLVCRRFMVTRFGQKCNSNSYRIRKFLMKGCRVTCGACELGEQ